MLYTCNIYFMYQLYLSWKGLSICCLQDTQFRAKDTYILQVREMEKIFHANENDKKAKVALLISDKGDFKIQQKTKKGIIQWLKDQYKKRI